MSGHRNFVAVFLSPFLKKAKQRLLPTCGSTRPISRAGRGEPCLSSPIDRSAGAEAMGMSGRDTVGLFAYASRWVPGER